MVTCYMADVIFMTIHKVQYASVYRVVHVFQCELYGESFTILLPRFWRMMNMAATLNLAVIVIGERLASSYPMLSSSVGCY